MHVDQRQRHHRAHIRQDPTPRIAGPAASGLLRYLPLLLVPAAVGVMVYAQAIVADFWAIVGALVLSLLLSLLFTGWLMQKLIDRQTRRRGEP